MTKTTSLFDFKIKIRIKFPYITQLKYCQKLDFEAGPFNKFKTLYNNKIVCSIS